MLPLACIIRLQVFWRPLAQSCSCVLLWFTNLTPAIPAILTQARINLSTRPFPLLAVIRLLFFLSPAPSFGQCGSYIGSR